MVVVREAAVCKPMLRARICQRLQPLESVGECITNPKGANGPVWSNEHGGWIDRQGRIWKPDKSTHGKADPHWDVGSPKEHSQGKYTRVRSNGDIIK